MVRTFLSPLEKLSAFSGCVCVCFPQGCVDLFPGAQLRSYNTGMQTVSSLRMVDHVAFEVKAECKYS